MRSSGRMCCDLIMTWGVPIPIKIYNTLRFYNHISSDAVVPAFGVAAGIDPNAVPMRELRGVRYHTTPILLGS